MGFPPRASCLVKFLRAAHPAPNRTYECNEGNHWHLLPQAYAAAAAYAASYYNTWATIFGTESAARGPLWRLLGGVLAAAAAPCQCVLFTYFALAYSGWHWQDLQRVMLMRCCWHDMEGGAVVVRQGAGFASGCIFS